jgi:hypothetical protein
MNPVVIVSIIAALVFLVLWGLALAAAAWIGGRLFSMDELKFKRMLPIGLLQSLVGGFALLVVAQVLQLSPLAGLIITVVLVVAIGLGELKLTLRGTWKEALKPWAVASFFQVALGIPSALLLSTLLALALNLLFPPVY